MTNTEQRGAAMERHIKRGRERERDGRLGVTSWQDNQRQATDSELGAQLV